MHRMTGLFRAALLGLVLSQLWGGRLMAQTGITLASTTTAGYKKSNQNKVFYHDGKWWALGFHEAQGAWYIWRHNGPNWTKTNKMENNINYNLDVVLDSTDGPGRLYVYASHHTKPKLRRYTYAGDIWAIDSGFPKKNFQDFVHSDNGNPLVMTQAKNGDLWLFRIYNQQLQAKHSANKGVTWSSPILISSNLNNPKGTVDAVTFSTAAGDFVGVGYGQPRINGTEQFGFFHHKDTDPENVWTDESANVQPIGSETSQNNISMGVDGANNVYMFVRTANGGATDPRNALYKRSADGTWSSFVVNSVGSDVAWQSPSLAIDGENGRLYLMGRNMSSNIAEYKACFVGQENTLSSAAIQTLFANGAHVFEEINAPSGLFNATTDILVTADNTTAGDIWYNKFDITTGGAPVTVNSVIVTPSTIATPASYTIDLTLGVSGGLTAGAGTITVTWPNDTNVPASIAATDVTVNGVAASAVVTNSAARTATVTVPENLANSAIVSLAFNNLANIINPSIVGDYTLQVATSAQPTNATSPAYAMHGSFVIGNITVTPGTAEYTAAYEIPLTLGTSGGLDGGLGTITVTWPAGTSVPAAIAAANVSVNGVAATAVVADQVLRRAVVTVPQTLAGGANVSLIFTNAAGIVNPLFGNYTLEVFTSVEVVPGVSPVYAIQAQPPVVVDNVTVSPNTAAGTGGYTVPITLGPAGGLPAGSGTITVTWPNDTDVPGAIAAAEVTVNGVAASNVTTDQVQRSATVTVPNTLANSSNVTLAFAVGANLTNPTVAGDYSLQVKTSKQDSSASSPDYAIASQPPVVVGNITVNSNIAVEIGSYTIPITIGPDGALAGGSGTITVTWPTNTSVPGSISASAVTVDGAEASAVSANSVTRQATVTVPNAIANNANVSLVFTTDANISNPTISGDYSLSVHTSTQTVDAASPGYTIEPSPNPPPSTTGTVIAGTGGDFDKPHQSRVFYHDGKWWLTALNKSENQWKLWKFDGSNWTDQGIVIADAKAYRPDCYVVNASNKLYVFASGTSQSKFLRLSYSGGAWSIDGGYPVSIANFSHSGEGSISFSRAKNGELWGFRVNSLQVEGIVSTNEGQSWSGVITVKSGLHNGAVTDCHAFSAGGADFMGVCYSENSTGNSIVGFLRHQDGANQSSWTDESGSLPAYSGTTSDDHINMAVTDDGVVYLLTKTDGGGATTVDNGLYKRSTNGTWQLFPVNRGFAWTRPTIGIDESNNEIYAIGTPEGNRLGYFKKAALGSEGDFENAAQETLFSSDNNAFVNLSSAQHNHTNASGLMVTVEHDLEKQIYYNLISFGFVPPPPAVTVNSVTVSPNVTNAVGAYTIGLTLGSTGSLTSGSGTITVTWPDNTTVPATIAGSTVTVNGVAASNVATNTANRFAVVTVPNTLGANASVALEFTAGAGIINPTSVDSYTLQVKTSAQPSQATSPSYNLEAPVPVVVSNVTVVPNYINFPASYQIPFTLGTNGALTGGASTIKVTWPNDTNVPVGISTSNVTVNGVNAAAVTTNSGARQAIVTVPANLTASSNVTLSFNSAAGIVNPSAAGNYTLNVQTSAQPVDATSPSYAINTPVPVAVGDITVTPDSVSEIASYTIPITLGAVGSLSGGSGTITVTWPNDTQIPASIPATEVLVNGANAAAVVTTPASRRAVVTVPNNLAASSNDTLLFTGVAGIVNPTAAGDYTLTVQTSAQPVDTTSPAYAIKAPAPVTVSDITVTPDSVGQMASYTIPITLGVTGALAGGVGTITVTWPEDTQVPDSIAVTEVLVNGANAAGVVTIPASRRAVVTVPNNLAAGSSDTLVFSSTAGIVNPTTAGSYTLNVHTSAQSADGTSPAYDIFSDTPPPPAGTGALVHANTIGPRFHKSNQSKVFYHDGAWWLAAYDGSEGDWYLWKYAAGAWSRAIYLESSSSARIDLVPDLANNRFFFLISHDNDSKVGRAVYSAGAWTVQATTTLAGIAHDSNDLPLTMALGANGHLWVFRIDAGTLKTLRSTDAGASWSSDTSLKTSLGNSDGMADCVTFSSGGVNYVGVFYSVVATGGGVSYGFLKHDDNAALETWTDESGSLAFFGNERADARLSAAAANDGTVYVLTANVNALGGDPSNTLYKRATDGTWSKFKVNTADAAQQWRSPALAIDGSNSRLYVMGVSNAAPNQGQFKFCNLGAEATLEAQTVTTFFASNSDNFDHLSAPSQPFSTGSGLMVAAANLTGGTVWFNHITGGAAKFSAPEEPEVAAAPIVEGASVYPNPFNPETTIRFALVENKDVRLQIFNIRGALVRTLVNKNLPRGIHEARWNGRDRSGNYVASGMYFYRLIIGSKVFKGSMQMIK